MVKVVKGKTAQLLRECERLRAENRALKSLTADHDAALVELAELAAAQDDALVELAELIV